MTMPIDIAGAGAFGTALAITLGRAGHPVTLWARDRGPEIDAARENALRLPGHRLPDSVRVTGTLSDLRAEILLVAVPTQALGAFLDTTRPSAPYLVSCAKGIHRETGLGPAALISAAAPGATVAQLTGPSFAADLAAGLPTALTIACADAVAGEMLQRALATPVLRLYRSTDVTGAELGGALKNVIAIACGACIGEGLGDSARAALMTRGFAELTRFAASFGARPETLAGLSGLGDLALTCYSELSRNYRYGLALGRQEPFTGASTVEGVATAKAVAAIAAERGIDMPICTEVARLVEGRHSVAEALTELLSRPLKEE